MTAQIKPFGGRYYIVFKSGKYLHPDLTLQEGTRRPYGPRTGRLDAFPGYYKTIEAAEETLNSYLALHYETQ